MSKGYLILAQNSHKEDYLRQAYALALSIKGSQSTVNSVALATDVPKNQLTEDHKKVFDFIVDIPWKDHAEGSSWKIENKWKYYYMTPFDETVILDADMIFPEDISHWWDHLSKRDVWITDKPLTYRGDVITSTKYRETFVSNELPNVYTAFMYFKKSELAAELYAMIEEIFINWERFYYEYLDETRPRALSGDVAYALAIKLLGIEDQCFSSFSFPTFVHMKSHLQDIDPKLISDDWTEQIPTYIDDNCRLKIGNYQQTVPFHYHVKTWLTDDVMKKLERKVLCR